LVASEPRISIVLHESQIVKAQAPWPLRSKIREGFASNGRAASRFRMPEIYCLYSPLESVPRYVGQTDTSSRQRWQQHIACALRNQPGPLYDWIRSLFEQGLNPEYHVLQEKVIPADLTMFERYWIGQFAGLLNQHEAGRCPSDHTDVGRVVISVLQGKAAAGAAWNDEVDGDEEV